MKALILIGLAVTKFCFAQQLLIVAGPPSTSVETNTVCTSGDFIAMSWNGGIEK